eukprot:COSAG01_NODE_1471_length_10198_cov_4.595703_8_plen_208_part_00
MRTVCNNVRTGHASHARARPRDLRCRLAAGCDAMRCCGCWLTAAAAAAPPRAACDASLAPAAAGRERRRAERPSFASSWAYPFVARGWRRSGSPVAACTPLRGPSRRRGVRQRPRERRGWPTNCARPRTTMSGHRGAGRTRKPSSAAKIRAGTSTISPASTSRAGAEPCCAQACAGSRRWMTVSRAPPPCLCIVAWLPSNPYGTVVR